MGDPWLFELTGCAAGTNSAPKGATAPRRESAAPRGGSAQSALAVSEIWATPGLFELTGFAAGTDPAPKGATAPRRESAAPAEAARKARLP
jgi:hypothetical protein